VGDFIVDQTGSVWICTVAGSPGTWIAVGGGAASTGSVSTSDSLTMTIMGASI